MCCVIAQRLLGQVVQVDLGLSNTRFDTRQRSEITVEPLNQVGSHSGGKLAGCSQQILTQFGIVASQKKTLSEITDGIYCHGLDSDQSLDKVINRLDDARIGCIGLFDQKQFLHLLIGIDTIRQL